MYWRGPAKGLRPMLPKVAKAGRPNGLDPVPTGVVDGVKYWTECVIGLSRTGAECEGPASFVGATVAAATRSIEVVIEVLVLPALGVGWCETRTALPGGSAAEAVAANKIVHEPAAVRQEHAVSCRREADTHR